MDAGGEAHLRHVTVRKQEDSRRKHQRREGRWMRNAAFPPNAECGRGIRDTEKPGVGRSRHSPLLRIPRSFSALRLGLNLSTPLFSLVPHSSSAPRIGPNLPSPMSPLPSAVHDRRSTTNRASASSSVERIPASAQTPPAPPPPPRPPRPPPPEPAPPAPPPRPSPPPPRQPPPPPPPFFPAGGFCREAGI